MDNALRVQHQPAPIRTQVLDNLRQAIIDGRFGPGQRIVERELVELMGVSRTSIREALRELGAEGLITSVPNKGIMITKVTPAEARQLYQVRSVLEGLAGRLFVENAADAHRKALHKALVAVERAVERGGQVVAAKDRFYEIIFTGGGNEALAGTAAGLHARVSVLRFLSLSQPDRARTSLEELRAIVRCVDAGDAAGAAAACSYHVEQAGRVGVAALEAQEAAASEKADA